MPGCMVHCETCGDEIINKGQVFVEGATLCRACAGQSHYLVNRQPSLQTPGDQESDVESLPEN